MIGLYGHAVPLAKRRVLIGRAAGCAAIVAGAQYILWRLPTVSGSGAFGAAFWLAEAVSFLSLVATVALLWRLRQRSLPTAVPQHSLDVFVTVCGEPPTMVAETVRAA